jgi:hypothetical protein
MDPRVTEFHCIMPMENIPSVLQHGILSFQRASSLPHQSVAMAEAQEKRDVRQVPRGRMLHEYANLYFHARNPMMYKRKEKAGDLCVLRVSTQVLTLDGVVLADRNAAGGDNWVRFVPPRDWQVLDFDKIFARNWTDSDQFVYFDKKRKKCAEVLVPDAVAPGLLLGAYVVDKAAEAKLRALGFGLPITIDPDLFFR